jgi:hypothetical protein
MATKKKLLQAAAGSAGGAGALNVEDVFSTYLYEGNGDKQFIDNGINLGQANDGYSAYFGGSGYYVGAEQTTLTDFTVEGWIYFDNLGSNRSFFTLGYSDLQLYYRSASSNVAIYDGSAKTYSFTPSASTWYHFALVRNGTSVELFIDGVSKGTQTSSATISGDLIIGGYAGSTDPMNGYISNIRVSDNVRYSSNFTAPTSALTTDANTTLLTLQDSTFIDNSGNGNVITPSGGAEMVSHAPFTAAEAGEGGLVWIKNRDAAYDHKLYDTERGATYSLATNTTNSAITTTNGLTSFNSDGFAVGSGPWVNNSNQGIASWTFKKEPSFFDIVTYTGPGTGAAYTVNHNLGSVPGVIILKKTSASQSWAVYHRSIPNKYLILESPDAAGNVTIIDNVTDSSFRITVAGSTWSDADDYVAYLFAHDTDASSLIKCDSYTGNGSSDGPEINLGWEPQWVLLKVTSQTSNWFIFDNMRGITVGGIDPILYPDDDAAEVTAASVLDPLPTGFKLTNSAATVNGNGETYIYMAIRNPYIPTITYDPTLEWPSGTAPTAPAEGETDVVTFSTTDGGTTYQAVQAIDGAS